MKRAIQLMMMIFLLLPALGGASVPVWAKEGGPAAGSTTVYLPVVMKGYPALPPPVIPGGDASAWPFTEFTNGIDIISTADGSTQRAIYYSPNSPQAVPLIVSLHTWSTSYISDYPQNAQVANWAISNGWVFIHPNFRGPNNCPDPTCPPEDIRGNPKGMGSDLVVQDIVDAVNYAKTHANIDASRIYIFGQSGGGHVALLMAGRHPEIWAGVSAWAGITDLVEWRNQSLSTTFWSTIADRYGHQIENSCGGAPLNTTCAYQRSPMTFLANAYNVPIDINAGFYDGYTGAVPIDHTLKGWNQFADYDFSQAEIDQMTGTPTITHTIPSYLAFTGNDPLYSSAGTPVLMRREWYRSRVTIFNGTHADVAYWAGLTWLNYQRK